MPLQLSRAQARRFLVLRHLLAPPRALPARAESVLTVIDRIGFLQFDPLEVAGARNHDLVLHARIAGYRRVWCDRWLYGPDRRLIELYNKSLNIVPIGQLPHFRVTWDRNAPLMSDGILREQAHVAEAILGAIERDGPLSTAAFAEHDHRVDWWWAPTRAARAVAEALFVSGRIGISRREGNRRYYDLIERLVPAHLLEQRESDEEGVLHRLLSRFQATGLAAPNAQAEVMYGTGSARDRPAKIAILVDRGLIEPVEVEDLKGTRYIVSSDMPLVDEAAAWSDGARRDVAFLPPLDPLMWDRRLLRELWDFDYLWEVYVPEAKRRWGYYVLPILFGDRLVGRFEPRVDRANQTLRVLGVWWQDGFSPRRADGFVPAMRTALRAFRDLLGARAVEWAPAAAGERRLFGTMDARRTVGRGGRAHRAGVTPSTATG